MKNAEVGCMFIVNGDRKLVRELEDRLFPGHSEASLCILKTFAFHEIILRDQHSELEVRYEEANPFQDRNLPFIIDILILNGYFMIGFQVFTNTVHQVRME